MSDPNRKRNRSDFVRSLTDSSSAVPAKPGTPGGAAGPVPSPKPKLEPAAGSPKLLSEANAGAILLTNVVYAIDYLKDRKKAMTLDEICSYLSLDTKAETARLRPSLAAALQTDPRVLFRPAEKGEKKSKGAGTYEFKPKHNIHSDAQLIAQLQTQSVAKGLSIKDLKEGWADVVTAVDKLEQRHEVLVSRQKKDNASRMVWIDDPTLKPRQEELDPEFVNLWHSFTLPENPEDLSKRLEEAGIKATSAASQQAEKIRKQRLLEEQRAAKKKSRRGQRSGGRVTNDHMSWALRDYSSRRK